MDRKSPSRLPRRLLSLGLIGLVVLAAGHTLLWRTMASELEAGWQSWVQLRRAQGWRVEHAAPQRGGWPLSASLGIDRLRLDGAAATLPGGVALAADRVVLRVELPWLDRLRVELPGQQRLRLGGIDYPFTADRLVALVPLEPGTPPSSAEVTAERLRIGTPAGGLDLRTARLSVQGSSSATEAEPALEVALQIEELDLPAPPAGLRGTAFGRRIATLATDFAVSGPMPGGRVPTARAEAWRDGGGTVELRQLALRWGPVRAAGAATLALDEGLQPMGAGTLRLSGAGEALDALAEAGLVGRRAAATARTVLPLLSRPSPETGAPEIEVPLTLEDRVLAFARIPVFRFDPLEWPAPPR
jgi:hypothetical protein